MRPNVSKCGQGFQMWVRERAPITLLNAPQTSTPSGSARGPSRPQSQRACSSSTQLEGSNSNTMLFHAAIFLHALAPHWS